LININTQTATLRELVEIADSGTWGDEGYPDNGSPVLRSSDIADNTLSFHDAAWRTIPENDRERRKLATGDIIVTKSSGSPEHIGKCAIFIQPEDGRDYYFSNFMLRLRAKRSKADHRWLFYWLSSEHGRDVLTTMSSTTSGLRNLSVPRYLDQRLSAPSLTEQKRIAVIIDKADAIRRCRKESVRLVDTLIPSVFYEMFGDPIMNPKGFGTRRIEEFCHTGTGGTPPRDRADFYGSTTPWVKSGELKEKWISATEEHVTDEGIAASRLRILPAGTILLALYGATVGRMARLAISATTNQAVCHIVPDEKIAHPTWLYHALRLKVPELLAQRVGGAQPNINQGLVRGLSIGIPPTKVQLQFAERVERCDKLNERITEAVGDADNLFNSLVQRAFVGGL
jgi:type I restriction enzyme S subunit